MSRLREAVSLAMAQMPFQFPHLKRHPGRDMVVAEVRECAAPATAVNPASQRLHIHNNRNNRRSSNRHPSPLRRHGNHEARGRDHHEANPAHRVKSNLIEQKNAGVPGGGVARPLNARDQRVSARIRKHFAG
jgi:hypothetical protein